MTTLKLSPAILNAPEYFAATPLARATWLSVALWAAGQGIARTILKADGWLDSDWKHACGVTRGEVLAAAPLLTITSEGVVIWQHGKKPAKAKQSALAIEESPQTWLAELASSVAYAGIDVPREHAKAAAWCATRGKKLTARRFLAWLNRCERPLNAPRHGTWKPTEEGGY